MIGMHLSCPVSGISGTVDAQTVQPDGKAPVRICDRWIEADGLTAI